MRLIFAGTSDFSAIVMKRLLGSENEIIAVLTQPDKPKGRRMKVVPGPVKDLALSSNIPVFQPDNLNEHSFKESIEALLPEAIVVAAYGKILPNWILELPVYGCLNIHASLLPRYRGAAPIRRAIMNGEKETGVSIMQVTQGVDTGPVFVDVPLPICHDDDAQTLSDKLAIIGADAMIEVLGGLEDETIAPVPQDDSGATYADKIDKSEYWIDWSKPAEELLNKIRALSPHPGAKTLFRSAEVKVFKAAVSQPQTAGPAGKVVESAPRFLVATGKGLLEILELQPANRRRMSAEAWVRGHDISTGEYLGT